MPPEPQQRDEAAPGPVLRGAGTPVGSQRSWGSLTKGYEAVYTTSVRLWLLYCRWAGALEHTWGGHAGRVGEISAGQGTQLQEHHGLAPRGM